MCPIADDHIQHDDCHLWITRFLKQAADAQVIVDHGMRAAHGEFFLA